MSRGATRNGRSKAAKAARHPSPPRPAAVHVNGRMTVELDELRSRLAEAEETLGAIRSGQVDALVVWGPKGEQVYTLEGAETPYRVLVEQMQEAALTVAEDGTILYANRRFAEMVEIPLERVLGATLAGFVAPCDGDARGLAQILKDARRRTVRTQMQLRGAAAERHVALSAKAMADDEAGRVCVVVTDLTEQRARERQLSEQAAELARSQHALRLAERLASIGTLATGLGHDMSNMLLPIRMRLEPLEKAGPTDALRADIAAVHKCVDHLQALADGLRMLALDPEQQNGDASVDIAAWWPDAEPVLRTGFPRQIALVADIAPGLPPARIARHSLAQAVFNLVQNAGDVLRAAGRGTVRVWARHAEPGAIRLGVTDDGPGMPESVRQRCLEPFFTTKTRRLSTGLGLALVHSIVRRADGEVEVESEEGVGTTFTLTLPAALAAPAPASTAARIAAVTARPVRVRAFVSSLLEAMGYKVITPERDDDPGDASLWVAPASAEALVAVRRFIRGGQARRAVVLGDAANGKLPARVVHGGIKPAEIRAALQAAARVTTA